MSRHRSEPEHTCPGINAVQEKLRDVAGELESLVKWEMENIRTQNEELRAWGQQESERADDLADEVKDLERKIERLEADLDEAREQIAAQQGVPS